MSDDRSDAVVETDDDRRAFLKRAADVALAAPAVALLLSAGEARAVPKSIYHKPHR